MPYGDQSAANYQGKKKKKKITRTEQMLTAMAEMQAATMQMIAEMGSMLQPQQQQSPFMGQGMQQQQQPVYGGMPQQTMPQEQASIGNAMMR